MTISWDRNDVSLLRGNLVFEDPGGRKLRGGSKFSPTGRGEPTPLDTMWSYEVVVVVTDGKVQK